MASIPKDFQGVFWSRDVSSLNLDKDKVYVIHQVLMFGSLEQIKWLETVYPREEIRRVFINYPKRIYTPQAFHFIKNYLLGIRRNLGEAAYVKTAF